MQSTLSDESLSSDKTGKRSDLLGSISSLSQGVTSRQELSLERALTIVSKNINEPTVLSLDDYHRDLTDFYPFHK